MKIENRSFFRTVIWSFRWKSKQNERKVLQEEEISWFFGKYTIHIVKSEKWQQNKGLNTRSITKTASVVCKLQKFDCKFSAKVKENLCCVYVLIYLHNKMVDTQLRKYIHIYINDNLCLYIGNITVDIPSNCMISLISNCSAIFKLLRHFSVSPKVRKIQKILSKSQIP